MKNVGLNSLPSVKGNVLSLTANLVFVAIFYIFLGATVSYVLKSLAPAFDADWESLPNAVQALDVAAEISVIVLVAFWLTYIVHRWIPIVPLPGRLEHYVESFGGQMVFVYAVFLFMDTLDDKLKHVFQDIFGAVE